MTMKKNSTGICYRRAALKRSFGTSLSSYNKNQTDVVSAKNICKFEKIQRRSEQKMNRMDNKDLKSLDWKERIIKSNETSYKFNIPYYNKIRRFEKYRMILMLLLTILFSNSRNLIHAANDDGNADDAVDDIFDDYYDDGNFNNINYDDGYFDQHNAMDDVINALDDFYLQEDDYVDIMQNGNYGFDELSFMPISCIQ